MSIYATLWRLKFPRYGDGHTGCDWIDVLAQGVPAHVGLDETYAEDPYDFLPREVGQLPGCMPLRAVVIVTSETDKGTERCAQEYRDPLLVLAGEAYVSAPFPVLHEQICDSLRGDRPRVVAEIALPDGSRRILLEDNSSLVVPAPRVEH